LFFHPRCGWIEKKLTAGTEMACDDLVLTQSQITSPRAYARAWYPWRRRAFYGELALAQAAVDVCVTCRCGWRRSGREPSQRHASVEAGAGAGGGVSLLCLMALSITSARLVSLRTALLPVGDEYDRRRRFETSQISRLGARVVPGETSSRAEEVRPEARRWTPGREGWGQKIVRRTDKLVKPSLRIDATSSEDAEVAPVAACRPALLRLCSSWCKTDCASPAV